MKTAIEITVFAMIFLSLPMAFADHDDRKVCFKDCPKYAVDAYVSLEEVDVNIF